MKKIILSVVAVAAIAVGYQKYSQSQTMSDLMLANVEALAKNESGGICTQGCRDIGWGTSQILKCDCSYTSVLSCCNALGCI